MDFPVKALDTTNKHGDEGKDNLDEFAQPTPFPEPESIMIRPIETLLVANRGEIARRILRTCRAMGIRTVAVYSDADRELPFVREADLAIRLGAGPAAESYLDLEALMAVALGTGWTRSIRVMAFSRRTRP